MYARCHFVQNNSPSFAVKYFLSYFILFVLSFHIVNCIVFFFALLLSLTYTTAPTALHSGSFDFCFFFTCFFSLSFSQHFILITSTILIWIICICLNFIQILTNILLNLLTNRWFQPFQSLRTNTHTHTYKHLHSSEWVACWVVIIQYKLVKASKIRNEAHLLPMHADRSSTIRITKVYVRTHSRSVSQL